MSPNHSFLRTVVFLLIAGLVTPFSSKNDEEESMERILQPNSTFTPEINVTLPPSPAFSDSPTPEPMTEGVRENLLDAVDLWNSMRVSSYELGFTRSCMKCFSSYTSIVEDGTIISVLNAKDRTPVNDDDAVVDDTAFSVENLFETIFEALRADAYMIQVEYDLTFGYPTSLYIDYDTRIADEELSVVIDSFLPLRIGNSTSDPDMVGPPMAVPDIGGAGTAAPTPVVMSPTASPRSPGSSSSLCRFSIGKNGAAALTLFVMGLTGVLSFD